MRNQWKKDFSFWDSTLTKKTILKKLIISKKYYITKFINQSFYTTPGFNLFSMLNTIKYKKSTSSDWNYNEWNGLPSIHNPTGGYEWFLQVEYEKSLRIKFKPGYSTLWRRYRSSYKNMFFLKFRYQHRLTKHIYEHDQHTFVDKKIKSSLAHTVFVLLMRTKFANDPFWSQELINSEYVFLNGFVVSNSQSRLLKGDFLQLLIHIKYYIVLKWQKNLTIIKKTRVLKFARKKFKPKTERLGADRNYRYPDWLLNLRHFEAGVPSFIELDFFTLSFLVIYNPFLDSHIKTNQEDWKKPNVIRLYNWKYIN